MTTITHGNVITAKINCTCQETGCKIKKGERMVYDYDTKRPYAIGSATAVAFINATMTNNGSASLQANEDAWFDDI